MTQTDANIANSNIADSSNAESGVAGLQPSTPMNQARQDAGARVLMMCAVLIASFVGATNFGMRQTVTYGSNGLPWWVFAIAFAATALVVVNIELHREVHALSFTELPLVLGLFFASPMSLILGRAVGELIVLLWRVRAPQKVLFNQCLIMCQTAIALSVFRLLVTHVDIERPATWLAAAAAVQVANLIGMLCISTVIRWHGGGLDQRHGPALSWRWYWRSNGRDGF